jgi:ElaB/YqjD/DUF883 family membrane-anchored ribosome-binding protein
MEVCKKLTLFCQSEMKSTDYDRVTEALDTNIPKLHVIQKEFEKEKQILSDIKKVLSQNAVVLKKYNAFKNELQQFVDTFPNNRDTDLKTIEQRIFTLNEVNKLTDELDKILSQIKSLGGRWNKTNISKQAEQLLSSVYQLMKFGDTNRVKTELQKSISTLIQHINTLETEALRDMLKKNSPESWQEDNELIISELEIIINKGIKTSAKSLQDFNNRIQDVKQRKKRDIANIQLKYKWLCRKRYTSRMDILRNTYIKFSEFQSAIETIRKSRGFFRRIFGL